MFCCCKKNVIMPVYNDESIEIEDVDHFSCITKYNKLVNHKEV